MNKKNIMRAGSAFLKLVALALPYVVDKFIDSRLDAEESEEFVREIVKEELHNQNGGVNEVSCE